MLPGENTGQRWQQLLSRLAEKLGYQPDMEAVLLFIGVREAGLPPKTFTEKEIGELKQVAICTLLVPARYYQLFWVDDTGWPHFKELQRIPVMTEEERNDFLKPYIIRYAEKTGIGN